MNKLIGQFSTRTAFLLVIAASLALASCATAPKELTEARKTHKKVANGPATDYAPAQLQTAKKALQQAEAAFDAEGDSDTTRALAYNAMIKAKIADVEADSYLARQEEQETEQIYLEESQRALQMQRKKLKNTIEELSKTRNTLEKAKKEGSMTQKELAEQRKILADKREQLAVTKSELESERERREKAEKQLAEARNKLQEFANVEEDKDQMVITLTGEVLFKLDESNLRNNAKARLDQVTQVLLADRNRAITVVGHTDSQGGDSYNQKLSQTRAESVRTYIISEGVASDRIKAVGKGEAEPTANNDTSEGRAMNRRVEIIVDKASNQQKRTSVDK